MLRNLHINNIAVIEKTEIDFEPGLNILTGETGAGKSIIIDSLNAVLGGRVSRDLVRHGCDKAFVSASFDMLPEIKDWLDENDIPQDEELFLSRTIGVDGKSACRINGGPVPARQLAEIGQLLMDIHGQNDGRRLLNESSHLSYLDSLGEYDALLSEYHSAYEVWNQLSSKLKDITDDNTDKTQLAEILSFRVKELEEADLVPGETEDLEAKHELMKNAERLTSLLEEAMDCLYDNDSSAVSLSEEALENVEHAQRYDSELSDCLKEIKDAKFMLTDAAEQIRDIRGRLDFSPEEFNTVELRLSKLNRLFKKYSLDEDGLISMLEESRDRLNEIEYSDVKMEKLKKQVADAAKEVRRQGNLLSDARKNTGKKLEDKIEKELSELSMPSVKFCTEILPLANDNGFNRSGMDDVSFLMSANAGEQPGKISRIASGGELSRIMLALKTVFAENDPVDSMVFDEIDTGVSGIAAQRVGEKMARLAKSKQVICITHLPQIACMADCAFCISKTVNENRTYTHVDKLDRKGRICEIARLREGENLTDLALKAAGEQLASAESFKASMN